MNKVLSIIGLLLVGSPVLPMQQPNKMFRGFCHFVNIGFASKMIWDIGVEVTNMHLRSSALQDADWQVKRLVRIELQNKGVKNPHEVVIKKGNDTILKTQGLSVSHINLCVVPAKEHDLLAKKFASEDEDENEFEHQTDMAMAGVKVMSGLIHDEVAAKRIACAVGISLAMHPASRLLRYASGVQPAVSKVDMFARAVVNGQLKNYVSEKLTIRVVLRTQEYYLKKSEDAVSDQKALRDYYAGNPLTIHRAVRIHARIKQQEAEEKENEQ